MNVVPLGPEPRTISRCASRPVMITHFAAQYIVFFSPAVLHGLNSKHSLELIIAQWREITFLAKGNHL